MSFIQKLGLLFFIFGMQFICMVTIVHQFFPKDNDGVAMGSAGVTVACGAILFLKGSNS